MSVAGSSRTPEARRTFPLIPRSRLTGLPFGAVPTRRRGRGSDVIGLRPYERGDPVTTIDWRASARVSATSGTDAFVVRDHAADEAPRVVLVVDRRPAMALYPDPLPWLDKRAAAREAVLAIVTSATAAQADLGALDFADGEPWWLPPGRRDRRWLIPEREARQSPFSAPDDTIERALGFLGQRRRDLPSGSFVFVLSDFLAPPAAEAWVIAVAYGWDVVPVVIQDPVWEQSFPAVGGVALPVADPRSGEVSLARLSRRRAAELRSGNARRHASLLAQFEALGLDPVAVATSDPAAVDMAFIQWSSERSARLRVR